METQQTESTPFDYLQEEEREAKLNPKTEKIAEFTRQQFRTLRIPSNL